MSDTEYEPTFWDTIAPVVFRIASTVMTVSFIAAGLAALYLLYGIFSGQLAGVDGLPQADRARIAGVVSLAGQVLLWGLGAGTLATAVLLIIEETTGYILFGAAIVVGFGVQFAYQTFGGSISGRAMQQAFGAFQTASYVPMAIGGLLIARDVVMRFISALSQKSLDVENLTFGSDAQAERKPVRTSLFSRCFEGPYCRESIRVHCPLFQSRKTCWKELRGCYCEEDIVIEASRKAQGIPLQMAPDARYNFANAPNPGATGATGATGAPSGSGLSAVGSNTAPQAAPIIMSISAGGVAPTEEFSPPPTRQDLTYSQKRQRCKNCIIYNEHMREKYKILMPIVLIGGILLCVALSPAMRQGVVLAFEGMERLARQIQIGSGPGPSFSRPPEIILWALVGAFALMILSKLLQALEWMCFKAKI